MTTTITYVGSHEIREQTLFDIASAGGGTTGRFLNAKYGANFSNSEIYSILPFQGATYNALQAQLTNNTGKPYSYGVVYTYSKTQDASDNGQLGTLMFVDPNQVSKITGSQVMTGSITSNAGRSCNRRLAKAT